MYMHDTNPDSTYYRLKYSNSVIFDLKNHVFLHFFHKKESPKIDFSKLCFESSFTPL